MDHICACRHCRPEMFPHDDRQPGEHHFAVRFNTREAAFAIVHLNGVELKHCDEAIAGEQGLVVVMSEPPHICRNCRAVNDSFQNETVCAHILRGHVRVSMTLPK